MGFFSMFRRAERQHELQCDEGPPPGAICILVHGTFTPGAPWTRVGSPIRAGIEAALAGRATVRFCTFIWRGKWKTALNNMHSARLAAGESLAQALRTIADDHPGVPLFLVGHSHGGNVILYALREPASRESVRGIATIATPFLIWRPSSDLVWAFLLAPLHLLCAACSFVVLWEIDRWDHAAATWAIGFGVYAGLMALLSLIGWRTGVPARIDAMLGRLQARYQRLGVPSITEVPKYAAYVQANGFAVDETFTWLAVGDWLSTLPRRAVASILASPLLLPVFLPLIVPFLALSPLTSLGLLLALILVTPVVTRSLSLFFGGESALMNAVGKIEVASLPPLMGENPSDADRPCPPRTFIAHGLYNDQHVIDDLSAWMAQRCVHGPTPPHRESSRAEGPPERGR